MSCWNVVIAALDGCTDAAQSLRRRFVDAWQAGQCSQQTPEVTVADPEQLTSERLKTVDLVIVTAESAAPRQALLACMTSIEQASVGLLGVMDSSLTTHATVKFAGGLMLPHNADGGALCAAAHGLLHRQGDFRQLRQELSLAQRFHGGLEGEIARMHEELQLAAMVQREMLPRSIPSLLGVSFAAMWRPANYVSGDIYDITQLDDEHIGVFITDAVGHGVPAALMTMIISRSLHTTEQVGGSTRIIPPRDVMARLNSELLLRQGRTTRFATGIYAVINCRTRHCTLAGAGHPPPLLLRRDGSQELLETEGGLLGVFSDEMYDQIELDLAEGDRLLLYSDGFEQAFPQQNADTYEQRLPTLGYREEFEKIGSLSSPAEVVEHIRNRVDAQRGSLHQIDDLTLICMCVQAADTARTRDEPAACRSAA